MERYNKAIVAVLGGLVTVLAPFIPGIEDVMTPEMIGALGTMFTAFFVYLIPNKEAPK